MATTVPPPATSHQGCSGTQSTHRAHPYVGRVYRLVLSKSKYIVYEISLSPTLVFRISLSLSNIGGYQITFRNKKENWFNLHSQMNCPKYNSYSSNKINSRVNFQAKKELTGRYKKAYYIYLDKRILVGYLSIMFNTYSCNNFDGKTNEKSWVFNWKINFMKMGKSSLTKNSP